MTNVKERENEQILWMFQIVVGRVEWFRTIDVDSPFPSSVLYGYVGVVHLDDVKWSIEPCREFVCRHLCVRGFYLQPRMSYERFSFEGRSDVSAAVGLVQRCWSFPSKRLEVIRLADLHSPLRW